MGIFNFNMDSVDNNQPTKTETEIIGNNILNKENKSTLSYEKGDTYVTHGFVNGFENSLKQMYNVLVPGDYRIPVNDTAGVIGTIGEVAGALANPLNLFPAIGAEMLAGKVASTIGVDIFGKTIEEIGTNISARIFKNSVGGAVGGAVDAYQRKQSELDSDYQSSILIGAGIGVIGGEISNLFSHKENKLNEFIQDTPNLKNDLENISDGGIPVDEKIIPIKDMQNQIFTQEQLLTVPEYKAPELSPEQIAENIKSDMSFKPYKIITKKQSQIKKLDFIDLSIMDNDLKAISELREEALQKLEKANYEADIKNKSETWLNSAGRKQAKGKAKLIQKELDDLEFMEAQINAEKRGKKAVLKTQTELDNDAKRFDALVERENLKLKKIHEERLAEFRKQQKEQEVLRIKQEEERIKNEQINKTSNFLYNNISNKSIEGLASHIDAHVNLLTNELDRYVNDWDKNALKSLEHGGSEKWLMKALYNEELPDELKKEAQYTAEKWRSLGDVIIKKYKKAGVPTGKLSAYYTMIRHSSDQIKKAGIEQYYKDINTLLKVPFSTIDELKPFYDDIISINPIVGEESTRKIENLSRRFIFKTSNDEIFYNQKYGYNFTPMQALRNNISYHSKRLGILNALGKYPIEVINKFDELAGANKEASQALINKLFPQSVGYFPTGAEYITAANFAHQTFKLIKTIANPAWQIRYLFGDRIDSIIYMAQKTSMFNAIKTSFKTQPDFIKLLSSMPEIEKTTFKESINNYKNDLLAANLKGHNFLSPDGKLSTITKLLRELEFNINGSHTADSVVRNCTATSYAYMLKDLYKKNKLFPNLDQRILAKAVDKNGFINPYMLLYSKEPKELEVGRFIASQYNEAISAVNPLNSTSWTAATKDNPGSLAWVKQASWTFNVTKNIQLPLLKTLVSSEVGGISKLRAGSLLVSFASLQTAFDEGFNYLDSVIEGKEYKPDYEKLARDFIGYMVLGHTFWAFKLSASTAYYGGKSIYYGEKYLTSEDTQEKYINEQKVIENAKKSSYVVKLILAAWHED